MMMKMASILFVMLKSPHENVNLELTSGLGGQSRKAAILFEDAVYYAMDEKASKHLSEHVDDVFVISDDLAARGFDCQAGGKFKTIDYGQAVDLIMHYDRTVTL
jgi:sulfur relay protein TusB/DsrH